MSIKFVSTVEENEELSQYPYFVLTEKNLRDLNLQTGEVLEWNIDNEANTITITRHGVLNKEEVSQEK